MTCPIPGCVFEMPGPLRICSTHYKLIPRPQQDALNHYARTRQGGPLHVGAYERAVESVCKLLAARQPVQRLPLARPVGMPYRDE